MTGTPILTGIPAVPIGTPTGKVFDSLNNRVGLEKHL